MIADLEERSLQERHVEELQEECSRLRAQVRGVARVPQVLRSVEACSWVGRLLASDVHIALWSRGEEGEPVAEVAFAWHERRVAGLRQRKCKYSSEDVHCAALQKTWAVSWGLQLFMVGCHRLTCCAASIVASASGAA